MIERDDIVRGAAALGVDLPAGAADRLAAYVRLLLKWNRSYNLTAIREPHRIVSYHVLDSLSVLPHLGVVGRLADIGSGAGLPGIPLAIACPLLDVVSIEAAGKKASFQQQARIELALDNFVPVHGRIEQWRDERGCDAVISRAFSDLAQFVRLAAPMLAPGGRLLAMKGRLPQRELTSLPPGIVVSEVIELHVPGLDAHRHLIVMTNDGAD
ncbi:MAG: 16S rRNA (guanine(527)-N(7))-methyltransferase RsmG [Zoogloeaceae bacterium]|nr:16S rRNA (guanine(527)-N(7))-methyltransferase RsmG [Rhodocyclaceae bacterium]MCP5237649.1 16S rRNA (guanine(527)-N(7))-methyltransferase RsmG [Zoogloeaceae bacterium]